MSGNEYGLILVYSTSHALRAEQILRKAEITCKLLPVPRQLSSNCGVCVRVLQADLETAKQALESAQVGIEGIHKI
jgi:hypothetical protein